MPLLFHFSNKRIYFELTLPHDKTSSMMLSQEKRQAKNPMPIFTDISMTTKNGITACNNTETFVENKNNYEIG